MVNDITISSVVSIFSSLADFLFLLAVSVNLTWNAEEHLYPRIRLRYNEGVAYITCVNKLGRYLNLFDFSIR